ncbi:hypothetical protein KFL_015180010 [Klebsormidium nitens]|uniref:Reverse transcriptase Ty1/copia-type domain-containing protein n=1 Tax=Klebsormidium nitens TaxID=105231 RepID=A0A1Y1IWZ0_KLENI|nr:hypothetical protein KFL_015180010 [Klebsormidium nitens]|eukprot:GAQ93426.1 hypothetical protein KFL_015180010 [Klebsormidium nitens]
MDKEMRSVLENGTWELVENPEEVKPVPLKWVYKIKQDAAGNVKRYESRVVAKSGARGADLPYRLGRRHPRGGLEGGADCEGESALGGQVRCAGLGEATYFLAMELARDRVARNLKLTQKKLTEELVARHGLARARARSVPRGAREKLTREGEPLNTARVHYSELIGSLLYLSVCTRPDIAQAVGALALYTSAPTEAHWAAALGVVRYLAGIEEDGITFGGSGEVLKAFCDADFAGDVDTRRSTTGYVSLMYGGAHIDVIYHFARERVAQKEVKFAYCPTEGMKVDILTKALAPGKSPKCESEIGIA